MIVDSQQGRFMAKYIYAQFWILWKLDAFLVSF